MSVSFSFDDEVSRRTAAIYMTPDVVDQRREVLNVLNLRPGERVLDVGSGPGFLAAEMSAAVGPSGQVNGIDLSESMIRMSQTRCAGLPNVEIRIGDARKLPFSENNFDAAVSTQVLEYLSDTDVTVALGELFRVLRPGGRALILDTDGDSIVWHSTDRTRMSRVLSAWEEHCADFHLPRKLSSMLGQAGFRILRRDVVSLLNPEFDPNTYSYGLVDLVVQFVPGRRGVTREEVIAWAEDLRKLGQEGMYFFSLNRYLFFATKPGPSSLPETKRKP